MDHHRAARGARRLSAEFRAVGRAVPGAAVASALAYRRRRSGGVRESSNRCAGRLITTERVQRGSKPLPAFVNHIKNN